LDNPVGVVVGIGELDGLKSLGFERSPLMIDPIVLPIDESRWVGRGRSILGFIANHELLLTLALYGDHLGEYDCSEVQLLNASTTSFLYKNLCFS
jgi:hypothetical protein